MSIGAAPYNPLDPYASLGDDPVAQYQRRMQAMLAGGAPQPQRVPQPPEPVDVAGDTADTGDPAEGTDTLSELLSAPLSALGWIGESLDKGFGGRTIRGLLGGQGISSLAHLIPFSDTLGLTDRGLLGNDLLADKNAVPSGRGLLEQAGVLDQKQPGDGFDVGDVAGIAAQALLDPAMWGLAPLGGLSALSKGGKIAHAIGELPEFGTGLNKITGALETAGPRAARMTQTLGQTLGGDSDLLEQALNVAKKKGWADSAATELPQELLEGPLGGLAGLGLPIPGASNITTLGHGPLSQAIGQGMDRAAAAVRYSTPGRWMAKLFNKPSLETVTAGGQIAAAAGEEGGGEASQAARLAEAERYQALKSAGVDPGAPAAPTGEPSITNPGQTAADALRGVLELAYPGAPPDIANRNVLDAVAHHFPGATDPQRQAILQHIGGLASDLAGDMHVSDSMGMDRNLVDPQGAAYAPRFGTLTPSEQEAAAARVGKESVQPQTEQMGDYEREEALKGWGPTETKPGGTATYHEAAADPRISGETANVEGLPPDEYAAAVKAEAEGGPPAPALTKPKEATQRILSEYMGKPTATADLAEMEESLATRRQAMEQAANVPPGTFSTLDPAKVLNDPNQLASYTGLKAAIQGAKDKAEYLRKSPPEFPQGTAVRFRDDPITDAFRARGFRRNLLGHADQVLRLGARAADLAEEGTPLLKWMGQNGFNGEAAPKALLSRILEEKPAAELARLGIGRADLATLHNPLPSEPELGNYVGSNNGGYQGYQAARQAVKEAKDAMAGVEKKLSSLRIPDDVADDAKRIITFTRGAKSAGNNWILNNIRSGTNLFKALNTAPWPANKIRDLVTGLWQSATQKTLTPENWTDAVAAHFGRVIQGANQIPELAHLSPEAASEAWRARVLAGKLVDPQTLETAELAPEIARNAPGKSIATMLPGANTPSLKESLQGMVPHSLEEANPLNVQGVGKRTEDVFAPVKAGRELSDAAWSIPRHQIAIGLAKKGVPWQQAIAQAKAATADFGRLTPFEQGVVQRYLVPFYSWTRQVLPWMLDELVQNPGGITAEAVKTVGGAGHKGFTPEQLGGDIALPLSQEDPVTGNKKFLSTFDLPFESLGDVFRPGRTLTGTVGNSLSEMAGMLTPALKVPLELATNRQLFSGRELTDLKGRMGTILQNTLGLDRAPNISPLGEELISNSPLARLLSTAGKLTDPRKSLGEGLLNTLTGVKTSDVNMQQARDVAARDAAAQLLQGSPVHSYTNLYVKNEDLPLLSPEERKLYDLYRQTEKQRAARAKAGRAQQPAGAAVLPGA